MTKSVAFYLPQYHPVPENDEWWGTGFTEWRNVAKAGPRFRGHYQPHLPADLGFYDLRLRETREQQASMARRYGVHGFCYYHYWFNSRRMLERPLNDVLELGAPDFPFMLCWANENWTRRWDGADQEVLLGQQYGPNDDVAHIRYLAEVFADPRYIRHDGKPVFLVYKASDLPDSKATTDRWREEYARLGCGELHICRVEAHGPDRGDPRPLGFDAGVEFQPDAEHFPRRLQPNRFGRGARQLFRPRSAFRFNHIYDYKDLMEAALAKPSVDYPRYKGITPSWDNSARRREWAFIFRGSTPRLFEEWMTRLLAQLVERPQDPSDFIFVNAWNEWAEGNHLEPDQRFGRGYLEAHRRALLQAELTPRAQT